VRTPVEVEAVIEVFADHYGFDGGRGVFLHENKMHTFWAKENHK